MQVAPVLRADAERNRKRVLTAARKVIARDGLDANVESIARQAGVGVGTVYRRFPTKADLVDAVLGELYADLVEHMERAAGAADPWVAFEGTLRALGERLAANLGLLDALGPEVARMEAVQEGRERMLAVMDGALGRAQRAGVVRSDAASTDVLLITAQFVKLPPVSRGRNPRAWERLLTIALDGLRPEAPTPLPGSPPARQP